MKIHRLFVFALAALLWSCNSSRPTEMLNLAVAEEEIAYQNINVDADTPQPVTAPVRRMIIKEGEISFRTSDPKKTRRSIMDAITQAGGYIAHDSSYEYDDRTSHDIAIRVPSANFESLLAAITSSAGKLERQNIRARDVTEEYIDVEARVKTKKELEDRYKELLKRASSVKDVLEIERELGTLRTEIESVEGRMKYLSDQVAYSTLEVTFYQRTEVSSGLGFGSEIWQSVKSGWQYLLWFLIGLVRLWPFILLGAAAFCGIRTIRRRRKTKKARGE